MKNKAKQNNMAFNGYRAKLKMRVCERPKVIFADSSTTLDYLSETQEQKHKRFWSAKVSA